MSWYVLQVITGKEIIVKNRLEDNELTALVPTEKRMIRSKGRWDYKDYVLIPSYVFVKAEFTDWLYHKLVALDFVIRILPGRGKVEKLTPTDVALLAQISDLAPSVVDFSTTPPTVIDGVLKELKASDIKFNRHARRAKTTVYLNNQEYKLQLSIIPYQQEAESEDGLIRPHIADAL